MSDLSAALRQIDMSQFSITRAASEMMKFYDRSTDTAVTEWRNALQSCRKEQLLPLLYVANEVLQNSKRNRGSKFLEAFSATLGQALQYICQRDATIVEKVRRTTKIWGDRRVFSVRFVSDLLQGLEPYRQGAAAEPPSIQLGQDSPAEDDNDEEEAHEFSPDEDERQELRDLTHDDNDGEPVEEATDSSPAASSRQVTASPTADDLMRQSSDDEDDELGFGQAPPAQLDVTIDASQLAASASAIQRPKSVKRRRSSTGFKGRKKRSSILSTQSLQDLVNQLVSLQQLYQQSQTLIKGIDDVHLSTDETSSDDLIGDALIRAYQKNVQYRQLVQSEKANLYKVAQGRRTLEQEARAYLPWCETSLLQDQEDLDVCNSLEHDLVRLQTIHSAAQAARNERRILQEHAERLQALEQQRLEEEEERKRLLEQSLAKQEEAKPGMVWNRATQEYQYLNTDESWRD